MKKTLKLIWNILQVVIIIYVILITSLLFFENKYGFSQFGSYIIHNVSKEDSNNTKGIKNGDLVIIKNKSKLKVGDTAYYYAVSSEKYIISSDKVTEVRKDRENYLYTVDKDNPMIISSTRVLGNKIHRIPRLGKIFSVVESKMGFIFLVLLPVMIVFAYQLYQFIMLFRYDKDISEATKKDEEII